MSKKHKATVIVAPREGFGGWWSAGRQWTSGQHENVELDENAINTLASRPGVIVLVGGKQVEAPEKATGTQLQNASLTDDEMQALEKYRAERAKLQRQAEHAQEGPGLKFTGDKKSGAVDRAIAGAGTAGATGGLTADTPLQNADILRGEPPPENMATTAKPLDPGHGKRK
jgi:hypothetical protein